MQPSCVSQLAGRLSRHVAIAALAAGAGLLAVAGCGGIAQPAPTAAGTIWLCRPGQPGDPCTGSVKATAVPAAGRRTTLAPLSDHDSSRVDCFYVYPTVSTQASGNANLRVGRAEIDAAMAQAEPFSQVCRVWAPMYRQRTLESIEQGLGSDPRGDALAYASLLSAWRDYLAHDNDGRPVVFIGDSQGAAMLIRLIAGQIDPSPVLRARTLLAIIIGGNVAVPAGRTVGGSFRHLPLCTATGQAGCVIAYSSFPAQPPPGSLFGRPGQGVSLQSGQTASAGLEVACVNPAALSGGTADLTPYFPAALAALKPAITTPWVTYPGLYSAACRTGGGASWLQVSDVDVAGRPVVTESAGPLWGYHGDDVGLALGNLVSDVRAAELAHDRG
jgi:hypothetical protein